MSKTQFINDWNALQGLAEHGTRADGEHHAALRTSRCHAEVNNLF